MPAPQGNKNAEKHSFNEWKEIFELMRENARTNPEILSLQDAFIEAYVPGSTFYWLCDTYFELEAIKRDIMEIVVSRVNKLAIKNQGNATACIWRMKQLGEKDKQEIKQENIGSVANTHEVIFKNFEQ